jgi:drug/metabolite transporter (DMT)-like permease
MSPPAAAPSPTASPHASSPPVSPSALRVALALAAVYVIWGSTFLGIRVALEGLPPFTLASGRFVLAGLLLYAWARGKGAPAPRGLTAWARPALAGALLFVGGNGVVVWAQQRVTSGLAALLVASVPLWVVVLGWASGGGRPHRRTLWGLAAGAAGVALLVAGRGRAAAGELAAMLALLASGASWAAGSLYTRGNPKDVSPLLLSAQAMLAGGALLLALAGASGEWQGLALSRVPLSAWLSLVGLAVFGSVVAFSAYAWLLRTVSPALASSYAFVNPAVAVLLGWAFAGEPVGGSLLLGGAAIVLAVALLSSASRRPAVAPRTPAVTPAPPLPSLLSAGRGR